MFGVMLDYARLPLDSDVPGVGATGGLPWQDFVAVTLGVLVYLGYQDWRRWGGVWRA